MYECVCLHVCIHTVGVPGALGEQRRVSDPVELELQMVGNCYLGAENQTQLLCRGNE